MAESLKGVKITPLITRQLLRTTLAGLVPDTHVFFDHAREVGMQELSRKNEQTDSAARLLALEALRPIRTQPGTRSAHAFLAIS